MFAIIPLLVGRKRGGCLTVDFLAMANLDNTDNETPIGDRIDDPIRSLQELEMGSGYNYRLGYLSPQ